MALCGEAERRHAGNLRTGAGKITMFRLGMSVTVHEAVVVAP